MPASADDQRRTPHDPRAWVAMSHPLRLRLMFELHAREAARAKDLAEALAEPANSVSFHLRQLARFGFIELDDARRGDAREKWWRTTARQGHQLDGAEMEKTREGREAARNLTTLMRAKAHRDIDAWFDASELPADTWAGTAPAEPTNFELHLRLTEQETAEFKSELSDVLTKWLERGRAAPLEADLPSYVIFGFGMSEPALERGRRTSQEHASDVKD